VAFRNSGLVIVVDYRMRSFIFYYSIAALTLSSSKVDDVMRAEGIEGDARVGDSSVGLWDTRWNLVRPSP